MVPSRSGKAPWDIALALAYTVVMSVAILLLGHGTIWAVLLVIFFPGYVLVAALFPGVGLTSRLRRLIAEADELTAAAKRLKKELAPYKVLLAQAQGAAQAGRLTEAIAILETGNERLREDLEAKAKKSPARVAVELPESERSGPAHGGIDWTERLALSFGLSIALVSLLGLLLNLTPWGIRLESIVVTLLVFTILVGLLAYVRRVQLPWEDRLSLARARPRHPAPAHTAADKILAALLAASIVFAIAVVVYVAITPRPTERFTQFFILDRNGTVDWRLYPTNLTVSEPGTVILVVVNNESVHVDYSVQVYLVGIELRWNPTTEKNETIELNRTQIDTMSFGLDDRGEWRYRYTFAINSPGLWRIEFLLFRLPDFSQWYNRVFLTVKVNAPG